MFWKRQHQRKTKSLILRIHDNIEPLPDFFARPANRPSVPSFLRVRSIVEWTSSNIKKNNDAFCIIIELNLQVLTPEDFHTPPNCN